MTVFEIVIPDHADRYASFLEFFDRQLKYSDLKRVTRVGLDHWDLSGGILSKGMVQIRRSGDDIVCLVEANIDVVPVVIIAILSLLFGLIFLVIALDNRSKLEREVRRTIDDARTRISTLDISEPVSKTKPERSVLFNCPSCGTALKRKTRFCPYCGEKLEICIVCGHLVGGEQRIAECPYCSGIAHREHLLEYVKIKGKCPRCGKGLKKEEVIRTD